MSSEEGMVFSHRPVMLSECVEGLSIKPDGIYVDGTAGGGGHSFEIAKRLTAGKLIAIDQDEAAIQAAGARLAPFGDRVQVVRENFCHVGAVCKSLGVEAIDGMLLDLGVSSYQLDTPERGFSYQADAPLDMRMDARNPLTAAVVVNTYPEAELKRIIWEYGEERFSGRVAGAICRAREKKPIETTGELTELVKNAVPTAGREAGNPAKRTFQAIRIEVNAELDVIRPAIDAAVNMLRPGGRIVIITFHSLEDRLVKQAFVGLTGGCTCPKNFPVCVCGNRPKIKIITKKPILPSEAEVRENKRSHSAKVRVAEKL